MKSNIFKTVNKQKQQEPKAQPLLKYSSETPGSAATWDKLPKEDSANNHTV